MWVTNCFCLSLIVIVLLTFMGVNNTNKTKSSNKLIVDAIFKNVIPSFSRGTHPRLVTHPLPTPLSRLADVLGSGLVTTGLWQPFNLCVNFMDFKEITHAQTYIYIYSYTRKRERKNTRTFFYCLNHIFYSKSEKTSLFLSSLYI